MKKIFFFLLFLFIINYILIKTAKGDLIPPVEYTQFQIMRLSPYYTIATIAINWTTDIALLVLILYLVKYEIKKNLKSIFISSLIGLFLGLSVDIIGFYLALLLVSITDLDYYSGEILGIICIFFSSFCLIYLVYHAISKYFLKVRKDKIKFVAIFMAIFTNPVWFTIIIGKSIANVNVYFTPRRPILGSCFSHLISMCHLCDQRDWPESFTFSKETKECADIYTRSFNITNRINDCYSLKPLCVKLGYVVSE